MDFACACPNFKVQDKRESVRFSWQTLVVYLSDSYLYFYVVRELSGMGYCMEICGQCSGHRCGFFSVQRFRQESGNVNFREKIPGKLISGEEFLGKEFPGKLISLGKILCYNLSHRVSGKVWENGKSL